MFTKLINKIFGSPPGLPWDLTQSGGQSEALVIAIRDLQVAGKWKDAVK